MNDLPRWLLRSELIQRGDVLLTLGPDRMSKWIARLSRGQFSHAALCIGPSIIFESDGGIIGRKLIVRLGSVKSDAGWLNLCRVPGAEVTLCAVFRHPEMQNISEEQFNNALEQELQDSLGRYYSKEQRLLLMAPWALRPVLLPLLKLRDRRTKGRVHGKFCSELVAEFFLRLGLGLFRNRRPPHLISPNDLAHSLLGEVEGAVVDSEDIQDFVFQSEIDARTRKVAKWASTIGFSDIAALLSPDGPHDLGWGPTAVDDPVAERIQEQLVAIREAEAANNQLDKFIADSEKLLNSRQHSDDR
jgi:hypothetical protein